MAQVIGLSLEWRRPLDGVEVIFDNVAGQREAVLRARSDRFAPVNLETTDFSEAICIKFLNSAKDNIEGFAKRFGLPRFGGLALGSDTWPVVPMALIEVLREDVEDLLFADFSIVDHVAHINAVIGSASIRPRFDHVADRYRLVFRPDNLSDYILLEAALARDAGATAHNCTHCGNAFLTGSMTGRRSTAKFCADRCRVAAMRVRKSKEE